MDKKFVGIAIIQVIRAMQIAVITNASFKQELLSCAENFQTEVTWLTDAGDLQGYDVIIDLLFENGGSRVQSLRSAGASLVVVNSVQQTLPEIDPTFVRINAWPGFLKSKIVEAALLDADKALAEEIFNLFGKTIEWLPDEPGFITPRVISMIINEAYLAVEDNVSSREDIDTAMRSGVNYPYGPFEWSRLIGIEKIASLLSKLAEKESRYMPSGLLLKESAAR